MACGSEPDSKVDSQRAATQAPEPADSAMDVEDPGGLHLTLLGEQGAELSGGAQLQVREQNPVVNLLVTAVYEENTSNLVRFQLALMGVENAMGVHRTEIGPPGNSAAFAVAYLEQQSYSSRAGTLEVTLSGDGSISGTLDAELFKDSEPGKLDETGERIVLAGTFQGAWSLSCRSPVPALPGDHSVSDSAYCNGLKF